MRVLSLQARLLAGLATLFVAALTGLGVVLVDEARSRQAQFDFEQAQYQARTLAETSVGAIIGDDFELMERLVNAALPSRRYAYAALVRPNGQILTHTEVAEIGHRRDSAPASEPTDQLLRFNDRPIREVGHPIYAGRAQVAGAFVAYYLDEEQILTSGTVYKIALTVLLLLLGLGLGSMFVSRLIISPVKMLTDAVSRVSLDNSHAETLPATLLARPDEVGQLAQSYSAMTLRLRQAFDSIKRSNEELEQRVEERTRDLVKANLRIEVDNAHLAAVMDNMAEGIVTLDCHGRIESLNRAAERLFGHPIADLVGKEGADLVIDSSRARYREQVARDLMADATTSGGRWVWELIGQHREGAQFPAEFVVSAMGVGPERHFICLIRDITARKMELNDLQFVANHDALTGLYNRRYFVNELERWLALERRGRHPVSALMFIDLDRFKAINDRYGHAAGDEVLIQVSRILHARARESDIVARMGGDEFAMLLHDVKPEFALQVGEAFRERVNQYRYVNGLETADVGCSIGVTMLDGNVGTLAEVIAQADQACYESKRAGRDTVRLFTANNAA